MTSSDIKSEKLTIEKKDIMQVITVELLNDNALKLLQLLEQLQIIRLTPKAEPPTAPKKQWAGALSKGTAAQMLHHVEQLRNEWERT